MASLTTVASSLPGLSQVLAQSGGGISFAPGSAEDLALHLGILRSDRPLQQRLAMAGRDFALRVGNQEAQMRRFLPAFEAACEVRGPSTARGLA
jgi:homoaconitase/3-isopropylmalate dehydratase large subunit